MALGSLYGPEVRKLCRVPSTVLESVTANCEAVETRKGNQVSSARRYNSRPPERGYKVAGPIIKSVLSIPNHNLLQFLALNTFRSVSSETDSKYSLKFVQHEVSLPCVKDPDSGSYSKPVNPPDAHR